MTTTVDVVADDGACSLREAVQTVDTGVAVDTCVYEVGNQLIRLPTGLFNLDALVELGPALDELEGAGTLATVINASHLDFAFKTHSNGLNIANMTIHGCVSSSASISFSNVEITGCAGQSAVAGTGHISLYRSTVADNAGRGVHAHHNGNLTVVLSTLSGNEGGAISMDGPSGALTMVNSTISNNHAAEYSAIFRQSTGGDIRGSIISGNTSSDDSECGPGVALIGGHYNLLGFECYVTGTDSTDLRTDDPKLLPLGHYGGGTRTHPLTTVGVDRGYAYSNIDQRGMPAGLDNLAFAGTGHDIGAFEVQPTCAVYTRADGSAVILCPDGSHATVAGPTGTVGTTGQTGQAGEPGGEGQMGAVGMAGSGCTVTDNGDNTATISCADGTSTTLKSGGDTPSKGGCSTTGGAWWWLVAAWHVLCSLRARVRSFQ